MKYKDSFLQAVKEYASMEAGEREKIYQKEVQEQGENLPAYIKKLAGESEGKNLPEGFVPQSTYWLIDGDEFIGRINIRHTLTPHLLKEGGHIGYYIRPSKRKQGYGKKILELALPLAKKLGIDRVLVTCDVNNTGSRKIIESSGGKLEDIIEISKERPQKCRYWIENNF